LSQLTVFPSKTVSENLVLPFSFLNVLAVGEQIGSVVVSVSVWSGTDASPESLIGDPALFTADTVQVNILGGISGVIYLITCDVQCEYGAIFTHHIIEGKIAVIDGGF
tara:strand:+ start:103 stop:426 length:324 start_codon:yes stop_codon:yes gene_type:complete